MIMAMIIFKDKSVEIPDGSRIQKASEDMGLQFGCKNGFCRTCEISVIEGYENLSILSENEEFLELPKPRRLACQCIIKNGTIKIKSENELDK